MVFAKQNIRDDIFGFEIVRVYKTMHPKTTLANIIWDEILHEAVRKINNACWIPIERSITK